MMVCLMMHLALLCVVCIGSSSNGIETLSLRARLPVACDLLCIEKRYQAAYNDSGYLYLPDLHAQYFGLPVQMKLDRLMKYMGLVRGSDQNLTDVATEMSKNQLQMRVFGFFSDTPMLARSDLASAIRVEHIYTLEEQGFVGIAVGLMLIHRYDNTASVFLNLSVSSATRIIASDQELQLPELVRFISMWKPSEFGIVGVTRDRIENNPVLLRSAAHEMGFKHAIEFDTYTGFLWNQDAQLSTIRMVCKLDLPTVDTKVGPLSCNLLKQGLARKSCELLMRFGSIKVNHEVVKGSDRPWIHVALDTGYANNDLAHFVDANLNGRSLFIGFSDIHLTQSMRITDVSLVVVWVPISAHQIELGLLGEIKLHLLSRTKNYIAKIMFPPTAGGCLLSLHMTGMFRVAWKLPIWIGNLNAVGSFVFGAFPTSGVFGAEVNIGWPPNNENQNDTRLKAMALVAYSATNIQKNYFYAKLSPITVQSLLNMMVGHTKWRLPSFLADSGIRGIDERHGRLRRRHVWADANANKQQFMLRPRKFAENPDQFIIAFSPLALQTEIIPELDSTAIIQPGLTVIGQVAVLGVVAKAYLRIDHVHLGVEIDLAMDKVSLGGGLVTLSAAHVQRTGSSVPQYMQNDGPSIYAGFQLLPSRGRDIPWPEFRISAAAQVLGVTVALDVAVSQYGFQFKAELNIWGWFVAKCIIQVHSYENGLSNGVRVYGELTLESLSTLARGCFRQVIQTMTKLKFWKKKTAEDGFIDHRRLGFRRKFSQSLKKLGKKLKRSPITGVKLLNVKFDVTNAVSKSAFPVFAEFQLTIFGKHLITYRRRKATLIQFDTPLDEAQQGRIAQQTVADLDECLEECEFNQDSCLRTVVLCESQDQHEYDEDFLSSSSAQITDRH